MIVICTKCRAKFRVADEKIGPRGAKVRCSQCHAVFVVHPDLGTVPAAAPSPASIQPAPAPLAPPPLPMPSPAVPRSPPPLPAAAPARDPFAAFAARERDPFASADPFLPQPSASFGGGAGPEPAEIADPTHDIGLALEERVTPPPAKVGIATAPEPALDLALAPPFEAAGAGGFGGGAELDAGDLARAGDARDETLALAHDPDDAPECPVAEVAPAAAPPAARRPRADAPAGAVARPVAPPQRIADSPGSRARAVVVNAIALAALLVVTLAILVVWRAGGPLDAAALRPAAILAALRGGAAPAGPFATIEVRSGLYERERAAPLLFVRGNVISRAPEPVPALAVSVAVVRAGEVLARGGAIAGAVPTAEELYRAADGAALAAAAAAARARAPRPVRPGDTVPFLVAIGDAPADLDGAAIRIEVAPAGSAPR